MKRGWVIGLFLLLGIPESKIHANDNGKIIPQGFYMTHSLRGRYFPGGSSLSTLIFYHLPALKGNDFLFENNYIDFGFCNQLSTANDTVSIYVKFEPVLFFDITMKPGIEFAYNAFNYGIPRLPSEHSPIKESDLINYEHGESDQGFVFNISPRLKFKIGPIVFAHQFIYIYYNYPMIKNRTIYNISYDARMKPVDSILLNSSYLLFQLTDNLVMGFNNDFLFVPSNSYSYERISIAGNYSIYFPNYMELSFSGMVGYFLIHEVFDFYLGLDISLSHRI